MKPDLARRSVSEALGTALLLATVVGSGIMGDRLAGGNVAVALLANTLATGAGLVALILTFGPISGAHFNPVVTVADAYRGGLPWRDVPAYIIAQFGGAFLGVYPGLDFEILPVAFAVVIIGGMGSLAGAAIGSLLVGLADNFGKALFPEIAYFTLYAPMVLILALKPTGLFGRE